MSAFTIASAFQYAKDVYFVIKLVNTDTGDIVHSYFYPDFRKISKQEKVQAMAPIPTPKIKDFGPNQYTVIVELREPETSHRIDLVLVPPTMFLR